MTEFRSRFAEFEEADSAVFGVSVDSVYCHRAFAEELGGLPFELIADFERTAVAAFGIRRSDLPGYAGVAQRSVFVIDSAMKVRWTWSPTPESRLPDVDQVLAQVNALR